MLALLDIKSGHFLRKKQYAQTKEPPMGSPIQRAFCDRHTPQKNKKKTESPTYRQSDWNSWNTVCVQPKLISLLITHSRSKYFLPHVLVTSIAFSIRAPASRFIFPHRDSALDEINFPRIISKS